MTKFLQQFSHAQREQFLNSFEILQGGGKLEKSPFKNVCQMRAMENASMPDASNGKKTSQAVSLQSQQN